MIRTTRHTAIFLFLLALLAWGAPDRCQAQAPYYSVQVSAFKDAPSADRAAAELKDMNLDAFSRYEDTGGKGMWHRVYVGRFKTRAEAKQTAEKLLDQGLIAGYTVRPLASAAAAAEDPDPLKEESIEAATEPGEPKMSEPEPIPEHLKKPKESEPEPQPAQRTRKPGDPPADEIIAYDNPDAWEIIVDLSGSTREAFGCSGYTKLEAQFSILRKMNARIPALKFQSALRQFAYKRAWTRNDYTRLVYGPETYDRRAFNQAIGMLQPSDAISPLGWAILAADREFSVMKGKKALIIMSDFKRNHDFGGPLARAEALQLRYGDELTIYTINVGNAVAEIQLAKAIAGLSKNGKYYDGCRLVQDEAYLTQVVRDIFGHYEVKPIPVCSDQDGDMICDDDDQCPKTPKGAPVDERGCWVAAYSQFFDFDQAEVKEEFRPRIQAAAKIINSNPHLDILIVGHTDSDGPEKYNMKLGLKRAEAVRDLLVDYGVDAERMKVESYGETMPIADNETEEGKARNRRVEFHVWEKK